MNLSALLVLFVSTTFASPTDIRDGTWIPSHANIDIRTDPRGPAVAWPWRVFQSSPYKAPNITITGNGKPLADGYIFLTPQGGLGADNAGFIMTSGGELVYELPVGNVNDFRRQRYDDHDYLTYWSGYNTNGANVGHGYGKVTFIDDTYRNFSVNPDLHLNKLTTVPAANGSVDIHEQQLTPGNTILVTAYNNTQHDLTSVNGSATGWIVDALIFEIDIATQEVLFSWRAVDHIPLTASKQPLVSASGNATIAAPWDWFHVNSIQAVGENYLVNSRHHWAVYLISGKNGSVLWSLEGEDGGSFGALPANGTFRWQHFVRAHNVTDTSLDLSLFDNHNQALDNGTGTTKTLVYHLELPARKASVPRLTRRLETPSQPLYAVSQGSYLLHLNNGNQFVGYGAISISREYGPAPDGSDLRWQGQFGALGRVQSYRGFKQTWHATPADWDPSLVVRNGSAYVSWNGATEVAAWVVYAGSRNGSLQCVGRARKRGFETVFAVPGNASYVQVAAWQYGEEVRRSNVAGLKDW